MHLTDHLWKSFTYVVSFLSASPVKAPVSQQQTPLFDEELANPLRFASPDPVPSYEPKVLQDGPIFAPPGGRLKGPGSDFMCDYSNMKGYTACSTSEDRSCWLRPIDPDSRDPIFDIYQDYETKTPVGVERYYELDLADATVNADGLNFTEAKIFNGTYPGPLIQACWGDVKHESLIYERSWADIPTALVFTGTVFAS